jgi:3-mercaptopyruvate sulfurtransferase SseA
MDRLVSTEWLAGELGAPDLKVIDASLFMPNSGRDARGEYEAEHIPGAVFLDLEEGQLEPGAAHASARAQVRQPDADPGPARRQPVRRLR